MRNLTFIFFSNLFRLDSLISGLEVGLERAVDKPTSVSDSILEAVY
jgi:hypothetical protein